MENNLFQSTHEEQPGTSPENNFIENEVTEIPVQEILLCRNCSVTVSPTDHFCGSCAYPIHGTEEEQQSFYNNIAYQKMNLETLNRKIKSATTTLYVLSGLCLLSGIAFYFILGEADNPLAVLISCFILAAIYIGLAMWSKDKPLAAIISGLILFVIIQILGMIEDPMNIMKGIIIKVVVIVYLVKGIQSATDAERLKKEFNLA